MGKGESDERGRMFFENTCSWIIAWQQVDEEELKKQSCATEREACDGKRERNFPKTLVSRLFARQLRRSDIRN